jgi:L,D-peptidoglycan transpeptidase YkuD (ErfK/YbiS/YcfS/YnhG family)
MKPTYPFVCLLLAACWSAVAPAQSNASGPNVFAGSTQMMVVTTQGWDTVEARLQRFERATADDAWHPIGEPIESVVGRNGLGWGIGLVATGDLSARIPADPVKKEGDGKSPAGVFALGTAFGYDAQPFPGTKLPYLSLTPSIECVDDVASKFYNRVVDRTAVAADWNSSEHMRYVGDAYRWGVVIDHNGTVAAHGSSAPVPGGGSCVFLHIWHRRDQGTAGCTAVAQTDLETLLTWLDPARKPLLVQLPEQTYDRLRERFMLPKLSNAAPR